MKEVQGTAYRVQRGESSMNREDFFKKLIRAGLIFLLGLAVFFIGKRTSATNNCDNCPGNGICVGDADCSKFLADTK